VQDISLVIPAFRPGPVLGELVRSLASWGFAEILVVDDGSGDAYRADFDALTAVAGVTVLRHDANRGKGAALKRAFRHVLEQGVDPDHGLVTLDADGQHAVDDVLAVSAAGCRKRGTLVLGARDFDAADLPWRSRFGNTLTRRVLRWTHGLALRDTQTGLRCLPADFARETLALEADRYEFELECLFLARRRGRPIAEHPIRTIYEAGNASSHFRPLVDSLRIYRVILGHWLRR
jgi:glycosyltransferase involved in cell wall biosynthesis